MYNTALKLINKITSFGYKTYIVGGYPRDLYLKRSSKDVDICTDARPREIMQIFPDIVTSNVEYGTVVLMYEKVRFEITTFRKENKYSNFRRPVDITYTPSLEEDIKRRDFTINTLCIDKDGQRIDMLKAVKDLDNKIIRMVGDPKIRLKEDALRILRAIRFATILDFELEPVLKAYIKKYGYLLKKLSKERKKSELDRIFASSNKAYGIKLLIELKLCDALDIPALRDAKVTPSMIATWSQLNALDKYNFSANERETIKTLCELQDKDILDVHVLYKYGLYECSLAAELQDISKKEINEIYAKMPIHSRLDIDIKPAAICEILDKSPGSFLKEIIGDLETKILDGKLKNKNKNIVEYITNNYK